MAIHFGRRGTSEKRIAYADTAADRLALSSPDVDEVVWQRDTETLYRWDGYEWKVGSGLDPATTETALYVDPVAGNDGYTGLVSAPLATIQEAIYRFIPPYAPAPYWARNEVYTINVVYTPGMPKITESIHIPLHLGEGTLHIAAEEHVEHSGLTQSGSLTTDGSSGDGYFYAQYELTATTSPFDSDTLGDGYFVRKTNVSEHAIETIYEQVPIITNTTNSLDIVMYAPGTFFGFAYTNASNFDVVRPQIEWGHPDDQAFITFAGAPLITIEGGMNLITGFKFSDTNSDNDARYIFHGKGPRVSDDNNLTTAITRCAFEQLTNGNAIITGSGLTFAGNFFDMRTGTSKVGAEMSGCAFYNNRILHNVGSPAFLNFALNSESISVISLSYNGSGLSSSSGVRFGDCKKLSVNAIDIRDCGAGLSYYNTWGTLARLSVVNTQSNSGLAILQSKVLFAVSLRIIVSDNNAVRVIDSIVQSFGTALIENAEENGIFIDRSSVALSSVEINRCGDSAISGEKNSYIDLTNVIGSESVRYGIEADLNCTVVATGTNTVTGTLGDALVGTTAHNFGATATTTDASRLCILDEA